MQTNRYIYKAIKRSMSMDNLINVNQKIIIPHIIVPDIHKRNKVLLRHKQNKYHRDYYSTHKTQVKNHIKKCVLKNKNKYKQTRHEWYLNNKKQYLLYNKQYYSKHKPKILKQIRLWQKNNPLKIKEYNVRYHTKTKHL